MWDALLHTVPEIFKDKLPRDSSEPQPEFEDSKLWWLSKRARYGLWSEAVASSNKHFQNDILAAVPDAAGKFKTPHTNSDWWEDYYVANDLYFPDRSPIVRLYDPVQLGARDEGPYDGMYCDIGDVDIALFVCDAVSRETWKREIEDEGYSTPCLEEVWDLLKTEQAK